MADTSAIYALLDKAGDMHQEAKNNLYKLSKENLMVTTTNFIVAECHALIA